MDRRALSITLFVLAAIGAAFIILPLMLLAVPSPRPPRIEQRRAPLPSVARQVKAADARLTQAPLGASATTGSPNSAEPIQPAAQRESSKIADSQAVSTLPLMRILGDGTASRLAQSPAENATNAHDDQGVLRRSDGLAATQPIDRSSNRRNARVRALGGSIDTENAVEAGLIWLAAHQSEDGRWDRFDYRQQCPKDAVCAGWALNRTGNDLDPGVTGLCLLAFLGAGYTDRDGPHQATVQRAVAALLRMQQADGGFSAEPRMAGYNNAIATLALAEFYGLTREPLVYKPLLRAVERIAGAQQLLGGWDYEARSNTGRNDTSISGWMVQALQASASAGIPIARRALIKAAFHIARATNQEGRSWYADAGVGFSLDDQRNEPAYRFGSSMTAVGLMMHQLLGWRPDCEIVRKQQSLLLADRPSTARMQRGDQTDFHDYYYWYYGTLASFRTGEDAWQNWNNALRDALLPMQERGKNAGGVRVHGFGAFPPYGMNWGKWGRSGSRLYSTAIAILTLEIYYRHSPLYLDEPAFATAADWREFLRGADALTVAQAVSILGDLRLEIGEPVLVDLLDLPESRTATLAALELAGLDSLAGRPILMVAAGGSDTLVRDRAQRALKRLDDLSRSEFTGQVRVVDEKRRMATLAASRAWIGMALREPESGARLRVIQRFSDSPLVVAEICAAEEPLPKAGSRLVAE